MEAFMYTDTLGYYLGEICAAINPRLDGGRCATRLDSGRLLLDYPYFLRTRGIYMRLHHHETGNCLLVIGTVTLQN